MSRVIDLSADMGEAGRPEEWAVEEALWPLLTSANVACGAHAGDDATVEHAVLAAARHRVVLGAHPSYPDRENFGRVSIQIDEEPLRQTLREQIGRVAGIAARHGITLKRIKPHGALYNDAARDPHLARIVASVAAEYDRAIALVCSEESELWRAASDLGIGVIAEAFADRRYRSDGTLVPRSHANALLLDVDEAAGQARNVVIDGFVTTEDGSRLRINADTLCIHSDMEGSVERLSAIRDALRSAGVTFSADDG